MAYGSNLLPAGPARRTVSAEGLPFVTIVMLYWGLAAARGGGIARAHRGRAGADRFAPAAPVKSAAARKRTPPPRGRLEPKRNRSPGSAGRSGGPNPARPAHWRPPRIRGGKCDPAAARPGRQAFRKGRLRTVGVGEPWYKGVAPARRMVYDSNLLPAGPARRTVSAEGLPFVTIVMLYWGLAAARGGGIARAHRGRAGADRFAPAAPVKSAAARKRTPPPRGRLEPKRNRSPGSAGRPGGPSPRPTRTSATPAHPRGEA